MTISSLRISNLRNISESELDPAKSNNLIWGSNGSGKTSILESIYLLGRGRSFRSSKAGPLIKKSEESLSVFSQYNKQNQHYRIGISKTNTSTEVKINEENINKLSSLASILPLHIITPQSHQILEREPEFRRRFIDWGVFHVEHDHNQLLSRFIKTLNQRNAALRSDTGQARIWDRELIKTGEQINAHRFKYLQLLEEALKNELDLFLPIFKCTFDWRPGWDREKGFEHALKETFQSDCKRGFTQSGPQRADLVIRIDGQKAAEVASRGQQKLLITALKIAQIKVTSQINGEEQILLLDDLAAELDRENLGKTLNRIQALSVQSFITATDDILFKDFDIERVFHVEHGRIDTG
ncbi:DNA replication/repair protein RecF [Solemya velesiana gill symbiont]|uniref:DNA replication and repair protein RecF n=1 Tax=Solemya velesiana gill symbiont TaxID=1918948 RepID=A0A1T2KXR0_9GAMM|nr:DNA replication/repair protein RecF [Solemya velesiana gill symbiont]OOZ37550.1 hypothetical protein BOW51_01690 [Solemya velesiana gill symbiont]